MTFSEWLTTAPPGDRYVYFTGSVAEHRGTYHGRCPSADLALCAEEDGLVLLFQTRAGERGDGRFQYWAQMKTPPAKRKVFA